VRALGSAGEVVSYQLNPLPRQLGQKHGATFPAIRQALSALDPSPAARALLAGESLIVEAGGRSVEVLPEEVEVRVNAREGYAVMAEGGYVAALVTELTPELEREGLAREFVRRVQDLRKSAGFEVADRIVTYYSASPKLAEAVAAHAGYILGETLSVELVADPAPEGAVAGADEFDGEKLALGLTKKP